jgi:hypothetical protein
VPEGIFDAVGQKLTFDGVSRSAHAGAVRAAALDHETWNHAVKGQAVIKAVLHKTDKIFHCDRRDLGI